MAEPACLQYIIRTANIKKDRNGVIKSLKIHKNDHKNCKYYADRFRGGRDLERRQHEQVVSRRGQRS